MDYCLESKTNNCKNCYKCIRNCPVKSISFTNNKAIIIHDDCILCGKCYLACPQKVKIVRNDIDKVKNLIANNKKVIVSLAPSFISNYANVSLNSIKKALLQLGFYDVEETAVGATIVKNAYNNMLNDQHDVIISSCCHSINLLIEKYYPEALPYLANVLSPMLAHGKDIKARYDDAKVVFIGPCIAKKDEADKNKNYIDACLTFTELDEFLDQQNIIIETDDNILIDKSKARFFPTCGGILKTMDTSNQDFKFISIDGIESARYALEDIIHGKIHKCFIEMSSCHGSCVNGPMIKDKARSIVTSYLAIENATGAKDFDLMKISSQDIFSQHAPYSLSHATPSEAEIEKTLLLMGKHEKEAQLNCGSCGYNSCREKAIAIIQGKAIPEMCLPYLMEKAQSFSDKIVYNTPNGLMVLDENLDIQLINESMCKIVKAQSPSTVLKQNITTILDPSTYLKALDEENGILEKKEYLSEYDKYVDNTIIHDKKFHILICIMKDITESELSYQKREETLRKSVEITNEVIEKNMRAVQEIASLLGESAAETKVALLSLKDTLENDK